MAIEKEIGPQRIRSSGTIDPTGLGILPFDFTGYLSGRRGVVTRMIAGLAVPVGELTNLANDTFTRVVANGWGTPDFGPAWTILSGTAANYSTNGTVGLYTIQAQVAAIAMPLGVQDSTTVVSINDITSGGAGSGKRILARETDASNYVFAEVFGGGSPFTIRLSKRVAGAETVILSTTKTLANAINCRFTAEGQTLSARWWNQTDTEPDAYDLATGLGPAPVSGGVGIGSINSALTGTLTVDNLTVSTSTPKSPHWDAYVGDISNPSNLVDSSQGIVLPRWVPALVNGQPISQGDVLSIVAIDGSPGANLVASCYIVTEKT